MIRGHAALVRTLRSYLEGSTLRMSVKFKYDKDDDGDIIIDPSRIEAEVEYSGRRFGLVMFRPSEEPVEGMPPMPLGRLAIRHGGEVVKGDLDIATWRKIETFMREMCGERAA